MYSIGQTNTNYSTRKVASARLTQEYLPVVHFRLPCRDTWGNVSKMREVKVNI